MLLLDLLRRRSRPGDHHKDQVHYLTTLRGVLGMLRNPEGTESVFDIEDGLKDTRAAEGVVARVCRDAEVAAMMRERYLAEPVDIDALEQLPPGTLGHASPGTSSTTASTPTTTASSRSRRIWTGS